MTTGEQMENQAQYVEFRPTLVQRFWRTLGFWPRSPEDHPEGEKMPGWIMTSVIVVPSIGDRLRFLICGHARARIRTYTSAQVDAVSSSSFEVAPPFAPLPK